MPKFAPMMRMTIDDGLNVRHPEVPAYVVPLLMQVWETAAPNIPLATPMNRYHEVPDAQSELVRLKAEFGAAYKEVYSGGAFIREFSACVVDEADIPRDMEVSRILVKGMNPYLEAKESAHEAEIRTLREVMALRAAAAQPALGDAMAPAGELNALRQALADTQAELRKAAAERDDAVIEATRAMEIATATAKPNKTSKNI